jgi:hypothetical protein
MTPNEQPTTITNKKKFYQKRWFWAVIIVLLIIGIASPKDSSNQSTATPKSETAAPATPSDTAAQAKVEQPSVSPEFKSALSQANTYSSTMHMSKQGLYDQLVSEYGGKFTPEAAQYAIENVKADWNANAVAQGKTYQNDMHLSPAAVRDQLVSQYGGKFTEAEADYAIQHLND